MRLLDLRTALSAIVLFAALPGVTATPATAAVQPCASVAIFGVRGSGQGSGYGPQVWESLGALRKKLRGQGRSVADFSVHYTAASVFTMRPPAGMLSPDPATKALALWEWNQRVDTYLASVRDGAGAIETLLDLRSSRCKTETPVLLGYSQGAMSIRIALRRIRARGDTELLRRIGAVGLMGDPTKQANDPNVANAPAGSRGVATVKKKLGAPIDIPDAVRARAILSCVDGDIVCDHAVNSLTWGSYRDHVEDYQQPFRADRLAQAMLPHVLGRSRPDPALVGTPTPTPLPPPAPAAAPAPPPAPQPPAPAPTVAETTGGVVRTWTNYLNAGGYEGPTIGGQQTVQISCKLTGFRVADGNTWWYRIASAPWNNNYYASADAFYNNGATSGSLIGTPFVDTNVPDCAGAGVPSLPGTVAETTGGVVRTWTNYLNAGGYEGPTIGGQQTVQISCKLTGFRVADGNTWWYRIASAPWNNNYYASADAFYNNGATSGSLIGTPFVDANVPDCRGA